MSLLSLREKFACTGLSLYVLGFLACMFMTSMEPVFYTLITLFTVGQIVFLIPCVMALLYPYPMSFFHPETVFFFGLNILLFAPQAYMLPLYGHFVHMFATLSVTGSVVCLGSFFFLDIFRTMKDNFVDIEYHVGAGKNGTKNLWRVVRIPKSIIHGEILRATVLLGFCLGILGTHLYAFVSLIGGAVCVILSAVVTGAGLLAGRSNWFLNHRRYHKVGSPPPSHNVYGTLN